MPRASTTRVWKPLQRRLSRRKGILVSMTGSSFPGAGLVAPAVGRIVASLTPAMPHCSSAWLQCLPFANSTEMGALQFNANAFGTCEFPHRGIAQALGGAQFAPQGRRLSLGALNVDVLYQPRRQDVAENATRPAAARQDRAEAPV